jgi:hypothetical protein
MRTERRGSIQHLHLGGTGMGRLFAFLAAVAAFAAAFSPLAASAKGSDCGPARVAIEGGVPSPFVLPDMAGQTLRVDPQQAVTL